MSLLPLSPSHVKHSSHTYCTLQSLHPSKCSIADISLSLLSNGQTNSRTTSIPHYPCQHNFNRSLPFCAFGHCSFSPHLYSILNTSEYPPNIYHHHHHHLSTTSPNASQYLPSNIPTPCTSFYYFLFYALSGVTPIFHFIPPPTTASSPLFTHNINLYFHRFNPSSPSYESIQSLIPSHDPLSMFLLTLTFSFLESLFWHHHYLPLVSFGHLSSLSVCPSTIV